MGQTARSPGGRHSAGAYLLSPVGFDRSCEMYRVRVYELPGAPPTEPVCVFAVSGEMYSRRQRAALFDQPTAEGFGHGGGPVAGPQLLVDVLEVGLHRVR